jgi:hypothetical protein
MNLYIANFFPGFTMHENNGRWFFGRARPLATFIEYFLSSGCTNDIDGFNNLAKDFVTRITKDSNFSTRVPSLFRLFDDSRFPPGKSHSMKEILRKVIFFRLCFGKNYPVSLGTNAFLFENAFGILRKAKSDGGLHVTVDEPIMLQTALNYFNYKDNVFDFIHDISEQRIAESLQPSSRGFLWEEFVPISLMNLFEKNKKMPFHLFGGNSDAEVEIWRPSNEDPHQVLFEKSDTTSLSQYLESPSAAFYLPRFEAGPDIVFFLTLADGEKIPVFVQLKYSGKVKSRKAALATTRPSQFYAQKKEASFVIAPHMKMEATACHKILKTKFKRHCGILIAYPMEWKTELMSTTMTDFGTRHEKVFDKKNAAELFLASHLYFLEEIFKE